MERVVAQEIQSVIKSDYTFNTSNVKEWTQGIWLSGLDTEDTIDIALGIDTQVMTDPMMIDIPSEVKGVMDQYSDFRIHLFRFDTEVHNPKCLQNTTWKSLWNMKPWWRWYRL